MSMTFKPKTEKEIAEAMLLPAGEYDFDVLEATDETSSKGNAMIKLVLGIYVGERIGRKVTDYIVGSMEAKLRHLCDCLGLLAEYQAGTLSADMCRGRNGRVKLTIQQDKTGQYPDKNAVRDYCLRAAKPIAGEAAEVKSGNSDKPDDLPF